MKRLFALSTIVAALFSTAQAADSDFDRLAQIDADSAFAGESYLTDRTRIRIVSEAQFQRDYGASAEHIAPGVYLMTEGLWAGKAVSMGIGGLRYDLAVLERRLTEKSGLSSAERAELSTRLMELQKLASDYASPRGPIATMPKAQGAGGVNCTTYDPASQQFRYYYGFTEALVNGGLYLDRGDGGFNYYYARMFATAVVNLHVPWDTWGNFLLSAS
ncbi:MAG: hypothetical protein KDI56_16390, partial [Xanthomonadales bacterium]|nr:hypothetical protein [Xanthomonadales bacterium]